MRLLGRADNGVRDGLYRGALEIRTAAGSGLNAINALGMEDYLLGVVPSESPSSWPAAALQAQAVAARSYALASNVNGKGFDQYADTRSQVYRGYLGETPSTNAAVAATAGRGRHLRGHRRDHLLLLDLGRLHRERRERLRRLAAAAVAEGRQGPLRRLLALPPLGASTSRAPRWRAKLGELGEGPLPRFKVLKRGVSPRVVKARIVGSRGSTIVTGPQIRARLGLRDTWFYVRRVSTEKSPRRGPHAARRAAAGRAARNDRRPGHEDRHAPAPHRRWTGRTRAPSRC